MPSVTRRSVAPATSSACASVARKAAASPIDVIRRQHRPSRRRRASPRCGAPRARSPAAVFRPCGSTSTLPARQAARLAPHRRRVARARHDQRARARRRSGASARERVGEERPPAGDREQLLRHARAAARPEARPGSSGHHDARGESTRCTGCELANATRFTGGRPRKARSCARPSLTGCVASRLEFDRVARADAARAVVGTPRCRRSRSSHRLARRLRARGAARRARRDACPFEDDDDERPAARAPKSPTCCVESVVARSSRSGGRCARRRAAGARRVRPGARDRSSSAAARVRSAFAGEPDAARPCGSSATLDAVGARRAARRGATWLRVAARARTR